MPLLGRKNFTLATKPKDIKANDSVFHIEETDEIFRSYEYPFKARCSLIDSRFVMVNFQDGGQRYGSDLNFSIDTENPQYSR